MVTCIWLPHARLWCCLSRAACLSCFGPGHVWQVPNTTRKPQTSLQWAMLDSFLPFFSPAFIQFQYSLDNVAYPLSSSKMVGDHGLPNVIAMHE